MEQAIQSKWNCRIILKGEYINPHVSIWWYKLDSVEEVSNPDMWLKANPNLGKTVSYETYQLDVERAEKAPAARKIYLQNDLVCRWKAIHITSHTKKLCHIEKRFLAIAMLFRWRPITGR